jgi:hypothetical protein
MRMHGLVLMWSREHSREPLFLVMPVVALPDVFSLGEVQSRTFPFDQVLYQYDGSSTLWLASRCCAYCTHLFLSGVPSVLATLLLFLRAVLMLHPFLLYPALFAGNLKYHNA